MTDLESLVEMAAIGLTTAARPQTFTRDELLQETRRYGGSFGVCERDFDHVVATADFLVKVGDRYCFR